MIHSFVCKVWIWNHEDEINIVFCDRFHIILFYLFVLLQVFIGCKKKKKKNEEKKKKRTDERNDGDFS